MTSQALYEEILEKLSSDPEFRTRLITQTDAVLKEYGLSIPPEQLRELGLPQKEFSGVKPQGFVFNPSVVLWSGGF